LIDEQQSGQSCGAGSRAPAISLERNVDATEVKAWRRQERAHLIARRMALSPAVRRELGERITAALQSFLTERSGILGVYWPFRAEFDPQPLIESLVAAGRVVALPVVVDKHGPLEYRSWRPGENLISGVWDIPIPEKREIVMPAAVLAPLVGFDRGCYRLGYGGGYFDRTLAALRPRPFAIGVGFEFQQLDTIYPQSFDIRMDMIVTEAGLRR
jgi:5-formyltetrahydrofolate cyclo-ligase